MINTGKTWHSPLNVYWHIQELSKKVGFEAIERQKKYQKVREARIGAVIALAIFKATKNPTYIRLYKSDPPDVILMQYSKDYIGQLDITLVEITSFVFHSGESLLEQLKRTKVKPGIISLSEEYILAVNVGVGIEIDYRPITEYLNENKTLFPVWAVQQIAGYPDTLGRVVIMNPKLQIIDINFGETAYIFKRLKLPDVLHTKRVARSEAVRFEKAERFYKAPWESFDD